MVGGEVNDQEKLKDKRGLKDDGELKERGGMKDKDELKKREILWFH